MGERVKNTKGRTTVKVICDSVIEKCVLLTLWERINFWRSFLLRHFFFFGIVQKHLKRTHFCSAEFDKYLLFIYCVSGTMPSAGDTEIR